MYKTYMYCYYYRDQCITCQVTDGVRPYARSEDNAMQRRLRGVLVGVLGGGMCMTVRDGDGSNSLHTTLAVLTVSLLGFGICFVFFRISERIMAFRSRKLMYVRVIFSFFKSIP